MIIRELEKIIRSQLGGNKAIVIMGARQTGKTTLLHQLFDTGKNVFWLNGDEEDVQAMFEKTSSTALKNIFTGYKTVIVDEAQYIPQAGQKFKLITDYIKDIQLIITGSSSFEIANKTNEPLTGRKWEYLMYPVSFSEMVAHHGIIEEKRMLSHRLLYGYYPEVITNPGNEKQILKQLTDSFLYKDLLRWEGIKKPEKIIRLLKALAYQVGNEVSYNELGQIVELDNETVEKYINLLEQTYVIFRLGAFSRNLRKELKRARKIYFYDNGIRNSLIANFSLPEVRQDIGALWENFLISGRLKLLHYNQLWTNTYFWRTQDQQEIDYIEERDGTLYAYEFKWNPKVRAKFSMSFINGYPQHETKVINRDNYEEFLLTGSN